MALAYEFASIMDADHEQEYKISKLNYWKFSTVWNDGLTMNY